MSEARRVNRVKINGREAGYAEAIPSNSRGRREGEETAPSRQDDPWIGLAAQLMDSAFYVPGTRIRFGIDPVIGLFPGLGDSAGTLVSVALIGMSARYGIPRIVLARMALNAAINGVVGTVPVAGDVFSVWFKSNQMNYELLRKHAGDQRASTRGDWWFVGGLILGVLLVVGLAIAAVVAFWAVVFRAIFG